MTTQMNLQVKINWFCDVIEMLPMYFFVDVKHKATAKFFVCLSDRYGFHRYDMYRENIESDIKTREKIS